MPSAGTLALFLLVATGVIVVPGPSNLYVLGRGLQSGHRPAIAGAYGCATAALVYVIATAVGLSALIASSETLFAAIHYAGAAYLCAIGVIALRRRHDGLAPEAAAAPVSIWPPTGRACWSSSATPRSRSSSWPSSPSSSTAAPARPGSRC
jgi:threonine/homoserine/homoserine lactone efflux protein